MSENVYLLHSTEKICLWIGKLAKMEAKKHAMHTAVEYIKKVSLSKFELFAFHFFPKFFSTIISTVPIRSTNPFEQ